jgi:hypothetical protein
MVLPDMFRNHKGDNETPLHVLERAHRSNAGQLARISG